MTPLVILRARDVYGVRKLYPANPAAFQFASIAGTRTMREADLPLIRSLGFTVLIEGDRSVNLPATSEAIRKIA